MEQNTKRVMNLLKRIARLEATRTALPCTLLSGLEELIYQGKQHVLAGTGRDQWPLWDIQRKGDEIEVRRFTSQPRKDKELSKKATRYFQRRMLEEAQIEQKDPSPITPTCMADVDPPFFDDDEPRECKGCGVNTFGHYFPLDGEVWCGWCVDRLPATLAAQKKKAASLRRRLTKSEQEGK